MLLFPQSNALCVKSQDVYVLQGETEREDGAEPGFEKDKGTEMIKLLKKQS